jgi:RHS repeat-associated protein
LSAVLPQVPPYFLRDNDAGLVGFVFSLNQFVRSAPTPKIHPNAQGLLQVVASHHFINSQNCVEGTARPAVLEETMDYFPYGSVRVDTKAGSFSEQKKFAGTEFDVDTGLNYMQARYYKSDIGRFVSQDPVFLAIGDDRSVKVLTQSTIQQILSDPQNLNSYVYGRDNPLSYQDSTGQWSVNIFGFLSQSTQVAIGNSANYLYSNNAAWKAALDHPILAGAAVGLASGAMAYGAAAAATSFSINYLGGAGTACIAFCGQGLLV